MPEKKIEKIKKILIECVSLKEYIVNSYIFCQDNFSSIKNTIDNDSKEIKKSSDILIKDINSFNKEKIFSFLRKKEKISVKDIFIELLTIDYLLSESIQKNKYLSYTRKIFCNINSKEYFILNNPYNSIFSYFFNKKYSIRKPNDFSSDLKYCFNNFIISEIGIKGYESEIINLNDISPQTNILLKKDIENITFAIFSNFNKPIYNIKEIQLNSEKKGIYYYSISNNELIDSEITKILEESYKENISIVLLPELFVYESSRQLISNWLKYNNEEQKIFMVIAGSMHIFDNSNNNCINESIIYDCYGKKIHSQSKISAFKEDNYIEYLQSSINNKFLCVDSSIGRFSISICLDFIDDNNFLLLNKEFFVNINFVPSLSKKLETFKNIAKNQGKLYNASTFCSNTISESNKSNDKGFIYFPIKSSSKSCIEIPLTHKNNLYYLKVKLSDIKL
ncbi:MAG: hypothetical protein AABZ74_03070 [Cyanobacteriota bacterium]